MKKLIITSILACLLCLGCKTTADMENGERPSYAISFIDNDGKIVGKIESGGSSTATMLLKSGEIFNALYVTRDAGGIQKASFSYPRAMNVIEPMRDDEDPPAAWVDVSSSLATIKTFEFTGNPSDRYDGAAYGIKFMTGAVGEVHVLSFRSEDFGTGGISTDGLTRSGQVNVRFTTNTTGVE